MTDTEVLNANPDLVARSNRSLSDPRVRTKKQCWDRAWVIAAEAHLDLCERERKTD